MTTQEIKPNEGIAYRESEVSVPRSDFAQLLERPASVYDKIGDPTEFSDHAAKSYASIAGAPAEHGFAIAMTCQHENITAHEYARRFHTINGRPVPKAQWQLAKLRSMGGDHEIVKRTKDKAELILRFKGKEYRDSFTWKDAEESRWPWKDWQDHSRGCKDNWATPTDKKNMLWLRLVSDMIGAFVPEVQVGGDTLDEALDAEMIQYPDGKPREQRPVAELLKENLERAGVLHEEAAEAAGDGRWTTTEATTTTIEPAEAAEPVAPAPDSDEGSSRPRVVAACRLVEQIEVPEEHITAMLAKRDGAKAFNQLTDEQLDEIIAKLEAKRRQLGN